MTFRLIYVCDECKHDMPEGKKLPYRVQKINGRVFDDSLTADVCSVECVAKFAQSITTHVPIQTSPVLPNRDFEKVLLKENGEIIGERAIEFLAPTALQAIWHVMWHAKRYIEGARVNVDSAQALALFASLEAAVH